MGLKNALLEVKWQIYRPVIFLQYGWGFLVVDLFLDLRDREEDRSELQEGWKEIKEGLWKDNPHQVAAGQATVKTIIFTAMDEALNG